MRRTALTAVVCSLCIFLYFLTLAVWLPTTWRYKPSWIREGIYAEYFIQYPFSRPEPTNSTFRWEIVSVEPGSVLLKDIENVTEEVDPLRGVFQGKCLWLTYYFNVYLRAFSKPSMGPYHRVSGIEELNFNGMSRSCYAVRPEFSLGPRDSYTSFHYDVETGILMKYRFSTRAGGLEWTLNSTNLDWTSTTRSQTKLIVDFVLLTPLFLMPIGAVFYLLRYRGKHILNASVEESTKSHQKAIDSWKFCSHFPNLIVFLPGYPFKHFFLN